MSRGRRQRTCKRNEEDEQQRSCKKVEQDARPLCVLLLVGLPGSGKSTLAAHIVSNFTSFVRVSQDKLGSRKACITFAKRQLARGRNLVIDRCNFDSTQRAHWVRLADTFSSSCHCIVLAGAGSTSASEGFDSATVGACEKRAAARSQHEGGVNATSMGAAKVHSIVRRMARQYVPPDAAAEGFGKILQLELDAPTAATESFVRVVTLATAGEAEHAVRPLPLRTPTTTNKTPTPRPTLRVPCLSVDGVPQQLSQLRARARAFVPARDARNVHHSVFAFGRTIHDLKGVRDSFSGSMSKTQIVRLCPPPLATADGPHSPTAVSTPTAPVLMPRAAPAGFPSPLALGLAHVRQDSTSALPQHHRRHTCVNGDSNSNGRSGHEQQSAEEKLNEHEPLVHSLVHSTQLPQPEPEPSNHIPSPPQSTAASADTTESTAPLTRATAVVHSPHRHRAASNYTADAACAESTPLLGTRGIARAALCGGQAPDADTKIATGLTGYHYVGAAALSLLSAVAACFGCRQHTATASSRP